MNQLEHIGLLGAFPGGLHNDLQRSSIGQQSNTAIVTLGQAEFVQQAVGLRQIEIDPRILVIRFV